MKRILFIIGLLFFALISKGQVYQLMPQYGYDAKRMKFDSTLSIPTVCGVPTIKSNIVKYGAIAFDSCNKRFYAYDPSDASWNIIGGGADSTTFYTKYRSDTSRTNIYTAINTKLTKADTISLENRKVPYTGATQDVDLGDNGLDAKFIKITGTAGNGHIDFKHQASDASATGNSTALFANTNGYLKWKNDNLYYSTLAMPQTADRVYTYQNKSYTLADSADVSSKLNASDTTSLSNRINGVNLQKVTDVGNTTSDTIKVASLDVYDALEDGYMNISGYDNELSFKSAAGNVIFSAAINALYLGNSNGFYAVLDAQNLSASRTYTFPDTAGTFILNADTSAMLTNYQRTSAFPIATFGAGSGAAGDTSAFTTSAIYGSFYLNAGSDTIIVTGYTGVVQGTSASVTPTIYFNDTLNVAGTKIVNSPSAVTSTTTGNTVTSLDNTKIPPGNFVWVKTETVTTKPTYFNLTLIGYRKR